MKEKQIYMYQSGFRMNHLTDLCLAQLTEFVLTSMDKQMHTGMVLVDFQRALDTIDHGVFIENMKYFGFWTSAIKWFESFKQKVCIVNVFSEARTLKCIVPQDNIFGPLLFPLYVNDLSQSISDASSYLYADDTCIFCQYENA